MKTKVFIEISTYGFSAYTEANKLDYSCIGEGKTVQEAIADFNDSYEEIKSYYLQEGLPFQETSFEFYYDVASFLSEYCPVGTLFTREKKTFTKNHSQNTGRRRAVCRRTHSIKICLI